jgi:hypothetical protein
MIIGCFTPLVKIFLPYFWVPDLDAKGVQKKDKEGNPLEIRVTCNQMLKDPERILRDEPFRFHVPRSVGAFGMHFKRPTNVTDNNLVMWLTGDDIGQQIDPTFTISTETDAYGVALIPLRPDVQGALVTSLATGGADTADLFAKEREQALQAHEKAVRISKHRAERAAKHMVRTFRDQRQKDKEAGRGHYVPSPAEYLAAYYLAEQETEEAQQMQAVVTRFNDMMDKIEAKGVASIGQGP